MTFWLACRLPTCMNTIVRMTPMTSQTMMVRMVLFTNASFCGKSLRIQGAEQEILPENWGRPSRISSCRAAREQVLLGAFVARSRGLSRDDLLECTLERSQILIIPGPLEHFDQEGPLALQVQQGEVARDLREGHRSRLVAHRDAGEVRRHVRKDQVGLAAGERRLDGIQSRAGGEIALHETNAGDGLHREKVDRDDEALGADFLRRDLRPAAGRGAQVDDDDSRSQESIARIDLGELVRRARTIALALRALHVWIAHVAPEPLLARG